MRLTRTDPAPGSARFDSTQLGIISLLLLDAHQSVIQAESAGNGLELRYHPIHLAATEKNRLLCPQAPRIDGWRVVGATETTTSGDEKGSLSHRAHEPGAQCKRHKLTCPMPLTLCAMPRLVHPRRFYCPQLSSCPANTWPFRSALALRQRLRAETSRTVPSPECPAASEERHRKQAFEWAFRPQMCVPSAQTLLNGCSDPLSVRVAAPCRVERLDAAQ